MNECRLRCVDLGKDYVINGHHKAIIDQFNLVVHSESVAIIGPSGCGKTTLLHLLATLSRPSRGSLEICGQDPHALSPAQCALWRNQHLGFVYQNNHLIHELNVLDNVCMPLWIRGDTTASQQGIEVLAQVGCEDKQQAHISELSAGQMQRVAIARAMITQPAILLADEPTGNLDVKTAARIQELLLDRHRAMQTALVVVTHDRAFAEQCDRVIDLGLADVG